MGGRRVTEGVNFFRLGSAGAEIYEVRKNRITYGEESTGEEDHCQYSDCLHG